MKKKKRETIEAVLANWLLKITMFYLFFLCLSVVFDNNDAVKFFLACVLWTFLVSLIGFTITVIMEHKNKKMKTVSANHRKSIEEERCRELSRVVLQEGDDVMITKQGKVYTYIDKPVEVIVREID